jgi:hypothetical protein
MLSAFATANPEVDVYTVNVDHPSVSNAAVEQWLAEHGGAALSARRLASDDPGGSLGRVVPGWADAVPTTVVLMPGAPPTTLSGLSTEQQLTMAIAGDGG